MAYDLEAELCGTEHLNKSPVTQRTVEFYKPSSSSSRAADGKIAGFFAPSSMKGEPGTTEGEPGANTGAEPRPDGHFSSFEYWREPLPVIDLEVTDDLVLETSWPVNEAKRFGAADLPALEAFLQSRSYISSYQLSAVDRLVAAQLTGEAAAAKFCNVSRWLRQVASHPLEEIAPNQNICVAAVRKRIATGENFSLEEVLVVRRSREAAGAQAARGGRREHLSSDEGVSLDDSDKENARDEDTDDEEDSNDYDEDDEDDEDGWITPSNLKEKRAAMAGRGEEEEGLVRVACMTTDFAMQNVLKQIGLNIIGTNGMIIRVSFIQYCVFKYIEFGSGSRILAQFGSGSRVILS